MDGICYPSLLVLLGFTIRLLHILIYFLYICNVIIHLVGNNRKLVINCTGFEHKLQLHSNAIHGVAFNKLGREWDNNGYMHEVSSHGTDTKLNGITFREYSGFKVTNSIFLSRNPNRTNFIGTINHELTHAFINTKGYSRLMDEKTYNNFSESSAYMVGQG